MEPKDKIHFHPEQVKYLEKLYPQYALPVSATEAEMRYYFGQQSVIDRIKGLVSK